MDSTVALLLGLLIGLLTALVTYLGSRAGEKSLSHNGYRDAVQGILDLKRTFVEYPSAFNEQMELNPEIKGHIPDYMDTQTFLAFAGGMWKISYVYSVIERWREQKWKREEYQGLKQELILWLKSMPGFYQVYCLHTSALGAHNPRFLEFLKRDVYNDGFMRSHPRPQSKAEAEAARDLAHLDPPAQVAGTNPGNPTHTVDVSGTRVAMKTEVGSVWRPSDQSQAASLIATGYAIGVFNRGVCAIWGDGANATFVKEVSQIKGEQRHTRPLGATLRARDLVPLIDAKRIPTQLQHIFLDADELAACLGSLCFIRVPITETAASQLPPALVHRLQNGTPVIQNWDPYGHDAMCSLLEEAGSLGVRYPAVTSMNTSGSAEIVEQVEGIIFAKECGLPLFLADPQDQHIAIGSYTILAVDQHGIFLVRDGNVPGSLFDSILQSPIVKDLAKPAKFQQPQLHILPGLNPHEIRTTIITALC